MKRMKLVWRTQLMKKANTWEESPREETHLDARLWLLEDNESLDEVTRGQTVLLFFSLNS